MHRVVLREQLIQLVAVLAANGLAAEPVGRHAAVQEAVMQQFSERSGAVLRRVVGMRGLLTAAVRIWPCLQSTTNPSVCESCQQDMLLTELAHNCDCTCRDA